MTFVQQCPSVSWKNEWVNGGLPSNVDPITDANDERVSPAISGASNFKSRFRDYRGGNEAQEEGRRRRRRRNWRESTNLRQLAGFRSDSSPAPTLSSFPRQKVGFRMSISAADAESPVFTGYVPF